MAGSEEDCGPGPTNIAGATPSSSAERQTASNDDQGVAEWSRDEPVSASTADWSREAKRWFEWSPARSLLASMRAHAHHRHRRGPVARLGAKWAVLRYRFWSVVSGADIALGTRIEGGLILPHPNGVVVHHRATIGPNCLLFQQVTIGTNGSAGAPILGGHVDVGAGAKILGDVRIGDHARIGANAVVLSDVPAFATAVGIPARVIPAREDDPVARPGQSAA